LKIVLPLFRPERSLRPGQRDYVLTRFEAAGRDDLELD